MSTAKPKKRYLRIDELDEFSGVDVPAQEGALAVEIGKRAPIITKGKRGAMADNDEDDVGKDMITCPKCGAKIDPDGDEDAAMAAHLKKCSYMKGFQAGLEEPYWKRDFSGKERERLAGTGAAMEDGSYPITNGDDLDNAIHAWGRADESKRGKVAAHIKSRAKSLGLTDKLPDSGPLAEALGTAKKRAPQEGHDMTADTDKLTKRAEDAEALAKHWEQVARLPEAQRLYAVRLADGPRTAFLAKSDGDRVKESEPVHVSKATGARFYSFDDDRLVGFAKKADADAELIAKMQQENADLVFAKRADEFLKNSAGDTATRVAIIKAVDNIADEKLRTSALESLRAGDTAQAKLAKAHGRTMALDGVEKFDDSPQGAYDKGVKDFAKSKNLTDLAAAEAQFLSTPEGERLYGAAEFAKRN